MADLFDDLKAVELAVDGARNLPALAEACGKPEIRFTQEEVWQQVDKAALVAYQAGRRAEAIAARRRSVWGFTVQLALGATVVVLLIAEACR